jgi:hypothetical protein
MLLPPSPILKDDFIHQEWLRQVRDFLTTTKLVTLDFPSTSANDTAILTVTIPGIKSGDTVIATPPSTFEAKWTWCAYVSANDTVQVRIHNNTGGADNPAAAIWRITVFKY